MVTLILSATGAALLGADNPCKPVFDAMTKVITTPCHIYNKTVDEKASKTIESEAIYVGGAIFMMREGTWSRSPITPERMKETQKQNREGANATCAYVRDEEINGQPAALYTSHAENPSVKSDSEIWISKSKGLPLKQELQMEFEGRGKRHTTVRYEYENIEAPRL